MWYLNIDRTKASVWNIDLHGVIWLVHGGEGAVHQGLIQVQHQGFVWEGKGDQGDSFMWPPGSYRLDEANYEYPSGKLYL